MTNVTLFRLSPPNPETTDNLDNISSKTLLEKRWQYKYRSLMDTISQFNVEDETGSLRLSGHPSNRAYLTIQGPPRRPRSYLQLENNLRNLFDSPSPPPGGRPPSSTPPPAINDPAFIHGSQRNRTTSMRSRTNS